MNGRALFGEGNYEAAISAFEEAFSLVKDPNLLYNISVAYERSGRYAEAATALDKYRVYATQSERDALATKAAELRAQAAEQEAQAAAERARREAEAKALEQEGSSEGPTGPANASAEGPEAATGSTAAPPGTGTEGPVDGQSKTAGRVGPLGWSMLGVAGAGLGMGLGLGVASRRLDDDAAEGCELTPSGNLCTRDASDKLTRARGLAIGADVSLAVGGAALATAIVVIALRSKKQRRLEAAPVAGPGQAGVLVHGRF